MCGRGGDVVESRPTPPYRWPTNEKRITIAEVPLRSKGSKTHTKILSQGSYLGKMSPQKSGFQGQHSLCTEEPEHCRKQRLHFKRHPQKSHILWVPWQRQKFERNQGQTHLLILENISERQETASVPPRNTDSHFWKLVLLWGHECWQVPLGSPPSRLLVLRTYQPISELARVLGLPRPSSQLPQDLATPTSRPTSH